MSGLVYTNNISQHHRYGIMGDGATTGLPTITRYFPGASVRCNVLAGGNASLYPTPNAFPTVTQWNASFVDAGSGDYRLIPGSPVASGGCSGAIPGVDLAKLNAALQGTSTAPPTPTDPPPCRRPAAIEPPPPSNQPPVADAGGPYTSTAGALLSADGTGSADPDGTVLDYLWHWGDEVLVRAAALPAAAIRGTEWVRTSQADAAGGAMILNPDRDVAKRATPLASPASYVEFTVNAAAGVPYYFWLRMRASNNAYSNDSLYVQFNGAVNAQGAALARIGTTNALPMILEAGDDAGVSGWGWSDSAWGATAAPVYFAQSGLQTIRIQQREAGVGWDQLILSSAAKTTRPGLLKNDTTIVDEAFGTSTGVGAAHRYTRAGTYPIRLVVTDAAGASATATTSATVR